MTIPPPSVMSELLRAWRGGDAGAHDRLLAVAYDELHRLAARALRREPAGHTLQTTALVHEAWLRLSGSDMTWADRTHFFAAASRVMRSVLVDHARGMRRAKRGGGATRIALEEATLAAEERPPDVLALDEALERLGAQDARKCRVIECRFFAGMTAEETAAALDVSLTTVERDLRLAKAWLRRELR